jgi:hypothetical protein
MIHQDVSSPEKFRHSSRFKPANVMAAITDQSLNGKRNQDDAAKMASPHRQPL